MADVEREVEQQLAQLNLTSKVKPGDTVAITAGSRGITNIVPVLKSIAKHFTSLHCQPFIVPAMGSLGGATKDDQVALLAKLGITESAMGCPIRSSMETVEVCQSKQRFPVLCDRLAFEADHVVVRKCLTKSIIR